MSGVASRYEFRAFAQAFGDVEEEIRRIAPCEDIRESREVYILRLGVLDRNVKVRDGKLDVKELIARDAELEQWRPVGKYEFPITAQQIGETLFPGLDIRSNQTEFGADDFFRAVIGPAHGLFRANVFKRRHEFTVDGCSTELDDLLVNGAAIRSVCIESEGAEAVLQVRRKVRLEDHRNVSYPLAVSRILGLQPMPDEDRYRQPT